jgi:fatty acid desaturase
MPEQSAVGDPGLSEAANLEAAEIRRALADLLEPRPAIYWLDFIASVAIGWTAFVIALQFPPSSLAYWVCLGVCTLALYRAVSFTHELVHLRRSAVPGFRAGWTLLCGAPLLVPNFLYTGVHLAHHARSKYGTPLDGEYLPFASSTPWLIVGHLLSNLVLPVFAIARFAIIGPVSFLSPRLRRLVIKRLSAMSLRFPFTREAPSRAEDRVLWLKEELLTSAVLWIVLLGVAAGSLPFSLVGQYALVIFLVATLNSVRAIGATHRYLSRGAEMSFRDQVQDSVNLPSSRLDALMLCPVGLRYHALHHALPTLPYHALGEGHRRLARALPRGAEYHRLTISSVWRGWSELLANIRNCRAVDHS